MNIENKIYLTAEDVSKRLGVSIGNSYKLIREMNFYLLKFKRAYHYGKLKVSTF